MAKYHTDVDMILYYTYWFQILEYNNDLAIYILFLYKSLHVLTNGSTLSKTCFLYVLINQFNQMNAMYSCMKLLSKWHILPKFIFEITNLNRRVSTSYGFCVTPFSSILGYIFNADEQKKKPNTILLFSVVFYSRFV